MRGWRGDLEEFGADPVATGEEELVGLDGYGNGDMGEAFAPGVGPEDGAIGGVMGHDLAGVEGDDLLLVIDGGEEG